MPPTGPLVRPIAERQFQGSRLPEIICILCGGVNSPVDSDQERLVEVYRHLRVITAFFRTDPFFVGIPHAE